MPPLRHDGPVPEAERPDYAGRYLLESRLGSGGMGVVHLATSASGLRLAVKVIHGEYAADPEFRARFRQEVAAARKVSGAFTAPVVDADSETRRPWMATLFIDGPTLSDRVKQNGPLDESELIRLGAGLAEALRDIHRAGVVHRDLKPSNVLLASDGPKVIDFGISRPMDSDLRTETGKLIGTPPFMAPEQFQRPREVGPAADVFAMGAVLVHAATGRGPFDSDSPYVVAYQVVHNPPDMSGVPESLRPLLEQCLSKEPADRPTPDELMDMLRPSSRGTAAYVSMQSRPAHRSITATAGIGQSPTVRSPTGSRSRGRWTAAAVAVVVLAGAGIAGAQMRGNGHEASSASGTPTNSPSVKGFHPWSTMLRAGTGKTRAPVCSGDARAVYCTAPGIAAARLDPVDGRIAWSLKDSSEKADVTSEDNNTAPVLSGGLLHVVVPGAQRLEALDPASGKKRWDVDISGSPAVRYIAGTVLLVSADGLVRSLDASTGTEQWSRHMDPATTLWGALSGDDSPVFAVVPQAGVTSEVSALNPGTGAVLWKKHVDAYAAAASDGALFLFPYDTDDVTDAIIRLDAETGVERRVTLPNKVEQAQATVAGDTVYVIGFTGSLLAVDTGAAPGEPAQRWRLETSVTRSSLPAVVGTRAYLSAGDGRLLAVDTGRGVMLGQTKPRMKNGPDTLVSTLPEPVTALPGKVIATAPDGSVFAEDSSDPAAW